MFCPNCGQDCGVFRFCPHCGTQMPTADQTELQKQEMPAVQKSKNTNKGSTEIPTSSGYLGANGSVVLSDSVVSVCVNGLFQKHRTYIPYDQLTNVIYSRPNARSKGALLFRGGANRNVPVPRKESFVSDKAAVSFLAENDTLFYHIYWMLKAVAPATAKFEMHISPVQSKGLEEMAQAVDMDYFFNMYAPHRERAASGIVAKHGASREIARELVNRVFDARQMVQYAADPQDAIRDLNLVVSDMRRKQQGINRMDADRRKRQDQEAVKNALERLETMKTLEMLDDRFEKHEN